MPAVERPALDAVQEDEFWSPHLDSELKALWDELKTPGMADVIELIEDCFGPDPWRAASEEYRALMFVLAFQHQADPQWQAWLGFLLQQLREHRRRMCKIALGIVRVVKRP